VGASVEEEVSVAAAEHALEVEWVEHALVVAWEAVCLHVRQVAWEVPHR
jgi:hypothetical protein